jgi:superfamily II DNA helicase RecQ
MKVKVFHIRLSREHLQQDQDRINEFIENVNVKKTALELVSGQINFWSIVVFYDDLKESNDSKEESSRSGKISFSVDTELTEEEKKILVALRLWREEKSVELNFPSFMICSNKELISIAKTKPQNFEELERIKGFAGQKIAKFGSDIIALLNSMG